MRRVRRCTNSYSDTWRLTLSGALDSTCVDVLLTPMLQLPRGRSSVVGEAARDVLGTTPRMGARYLRREDQCHNWLLTETSPQNDIEHVPRSLEGYERVGNSWYVLQFLCPTVRRSKLLCTAMERATYTSKSFLIALALVKKHISVDYAAQLAHVEVNSQIKTWGEVEDSEYPAIACCKFILILRSRRGIAHDVDYHDVRRQLGSAACILANHQA